MDKWTMFKNYMHNELGITREDIRNWIEDAVHNEAEKLIANEFKKFDIKKEITNIIRDPRYFSSVHLKEDILKEIGKQIMEHIKIE